jgi:hypothetical protein
MQAAIRAFSVPVTLASSKKIDAPLSLGAQLFERLQVGVNTPAADHIAPWRRQRDLAKAGQHGAGKQNRGADLLTQAGVESRVRDPVGLQSYVVRAQFLHADPHLLQDVQHGAHIADTWQIVKDDRLICKQTGS